MCVSVCVFVNLEFFLVQETVVPLQVQVLLLLVAQLPLCRAEQTLGSLQVLLHLLALLDLLTEHQVLGLKRQQRDGLTGACNNQNDESNIIFLKKECDSTIGNY